MGLVMDSVCSALRPDGVLILVIGHGRTGSGPEKTNLNMQGIFRGLLAERRSQLELKHVITEHITSNKRYYHALSTTNGHTSDERREYILVAKRR
jgi:hypothetical protein